MRRFGVPIDEYAIKNLDVGITFESEHGIVSELEEREAAVFTGYTWIEWQNISAWERAASVAHYRSHNIVEMHVNDAANKEMERQSRKGGH